MTSHVDQTQSFPNAMGERVSSPMILPRRVLVRLGLIVGAVLVAAVIGLAILVLATSGVRLPPPVTVADPNSQVQTGQSSTVSEAVFATNLFYAGSTKTSSGMIRCVPSGRWTLDVNPEDVVGHPYVAAPGRHDWARAARAVNAALGICQAPVTLSWLAHDRAHPSSDQWTAILPASMSSLDGVALQRYALAHARQQ